MPNGCASERASALLLLPLRLYCRRALLLLPLAPPALREVILRPRNNSERELARGNEIYSSGLRAGELTTTPARRGSASSHRRPLGRAIEGCSFLTGACESPSTLLPYCSRRLRRRRSLCFPAISRKSLGTPRHFVPHCLTCALTIRSEST